MITDKLSTLRNLADWLAYIASLHPEEIELGLERVRRARQRLAINPSCPIIIIAGTNGKGSCAAGLTSIYRAAGYAVGTFTSPYLFTFNEQVSINGQPVTDEALCSAFRKVGEACMGIELTTFEFLTLAALLIFTGQPLDVLILEVGLGGRLDAVNVMDADVAIVTSIAIDHVDWLGATRELIGKEKAGIFRSARPAICGDQDPPHSLVAYAEQIGAVLYRQGREFSYAEEKSSWSFSSHTQKKAYQALPLTSLATQNMSTVLMAVTLLQPQLPVSEKTLRHALAHIHLPGRIQIIEGEVQKIYDVSHNPASVQHLATRLQSMPHQGKTFAVFSMLADKDISASIDAIKSVIDEWHIAPLPQTIKRSANIEQLKAAFHGSEIIHIHASVEEAFFAAGQRATRGDRIVVFGSFHTVAALLPH